MTTVMVGDLFKRPNEGVWGLRGDPYLWAIFQAKFEHTPMPKDPYALRTLLYDGFREVTGYSIERDAPIYIQFLNTNRGMSAGMVSGYWWRLTGIPILLDRAWSMEAFPNLPTHQDIPDTNQHMIEFVVMAWRRTTEA